jgi:hypothetical protein
MKYNRENMEILAQAVVDSWDMKNLIIFANDFSNGYFEPLFPYYIIKCRNCKKETRIKT